MRHVGIWTHELRKWQTEAFDLCLEKINRGQKDFLCEATPGGGKTRLALRIVHKFLQQEQAKRVVIVVPTEHLKKQWAEEASKFRIDLDPYFDNSMERECADFHGVVLTYAQIGLNPAVHQNAVNNKKTIVVLDEIHHAGSSLTWGDGVKQAFDGAVFRLGLSGTPFRNDDNVIPFVNYENRVSVFDYSYNYEEAVIDNVCRPIYFPAYDGEMEWEKGEEKFKHTFDDILDDTKSGERLKTALSVNGDFLRQMIIDADNKITEIREKEYHADAGGLIIAIDQNHAKQIAELVTRLTRRKPVVAVTDDKQSSNRIKKFRASDDRWLIAVKMVSEGVDIPRLRVGVYATNITSELFFRQAIGRFVRILSNLETQEAYVYLPKDPRILEYAQTIEQEREHALDEVKKTDSSQTDDSNPAEKSKNSEEPKAGKFKAVSAITTGNEQLSFLVDNKKISKMFNISQDISVTILANVSAPEQTEQEIFDHLPVFEKRKILREDIAELARIYAKLKNNGSGGEIDWQIGHKEWIRQGGKSIEKETVPELIHRKKWLEERI